MAGLFIYLCIKYKLVKECGKKFPSVHNKRKGKGWKRALTSNSTVETRYQASIPIFECGKTNTSIGGNTKRPMIK